MYIYIYVCIYIHNSLHRYARMYIHIYTAQAASGSVLSDTIPQKCLERIFISFYISITDFIDIFIGVCGLPMDPMDQWVHLPDLRSNYRCGISCCAQCHCEVGAAESVSEHFFGGCVNDG